jgi:hypothetical protein
VTNLPLLAASSLWPVFSPCHPTGAVENPARARAREAILSEKLIDKAPANPYTTEHNHSTTPIRVAQLHLIPHQAHTIGGMLDCI